MSVRSRNGCLNCKKRKRRCGEERPACRNCELRGFDCSYLFETSQPAPLRFKISLSKGHRSILKRRKRWQFLSVSYHDADVLLCEHYHHLPTPPSRPSIERDSHTDDYPTTFSAEPSPFAALLIDCGDLETQLFQYYLQVICKVRVFQDEPRNKFRSLVVPFCSRRKPLWYAVLSMSANDRRAEEAVTTTTINYAQLSLSYKSVALQLLRESLTKLEDINEALMTCLILCSLEIACGCRPDWVRHAQGAFAIINSYVSAIDPEILFFAQSYFQSRALFFRTTGCYPPGRQITPLLQDHSAPLKAYTSPDRWTPEIFSWDVHLYNDDHKTTYQPHIGCSLGLLDIIARATDLVSQKQHLRSTGTSSLASEGAMMHQAMCLRSELDALDEVYPPTASNSEYLATCGQCFRLAADLYLQLACDMPLTQHTLQKLLVKLLGHIGRVIREDQERQLFPMWPLFLAGCLSTADEDRVRVLTYFTYLTQSWPVSNVPVAREAMETVWKYRDLNPHDTGSGLDWQMILSRMNWTLALS
ncbi:Zn(II)2Cys6 transcription factor [Aspergillus saccharolyticus JOP 1030-1]|uniref:Zn(2)-C6 fungal-type domain-containing protein n=1 Tax=Aspergillus saccharolyticus JOP 1030-1 TaxID=1450539 RepID=A0A318ZXS2_9EURO|nr:hypothetical protein BP01DRAFT_311742 [Aspergillus saccharolyticus JOP 1030-1]PYH48960.1 hypothetical protein BP01DRAFT_311742 [Aspergillus saccharolyticus JOP 1030-1]